MYCPNCGNQNSADQKFCRSCGLGLQKVAQTLSEQLPTKLDVSLQQKKERFEKLGVAALSIFGAGVAIPILYGIFYKMMWTQGKVAAGLGLLARTRAEDFPELQLEEEGRVVRELARGGFRAAPPVVPLDGVWVVDDEEPVPGGVEGKPLGRDPLDGSSVGDIAA